MFDYDVTIVTLTHAEGLLSFRSLKSAKRSADYAETYGLKVEVLVVMDNPTLQTKNCIESNGAFYSSLYLTDFSNPSKAREFGALQAKGKYLAFLDGDDLFSQNWVLEAFTFINNAKKKDIVLHPEYNLIFETEHLLVKNLDQESPDFKKLILFESNPWSALSFVSRDIFLQLPHKDFAAVGGYGYEDWHWNCETIARGYIHKVVPKTAHFIRRKKALSLSRQSSLRKDLLAFTSLFDMKDFWEDVEIGIPTKKLEFFNAFKSSLRFSAKEFLKAFTNYWQSMPEKYRIHIRIFAKKIIFFWYKKKRNLNMMPWLEKELKEISSIEAQLFPSRKLLAQTKNVYHLDNRLASLYYEIKKQLSGVKPTHVVLAPAVRVGGADALVLHHIKATQDYPNTSTLLITTEAISSTRLPKSFPNFQVLELGNICKHLNYEDRKWLLTRLMIQLSPKTIHNIQSPIGFKMFIDHGPALKTHSKLFASVFADDYSDEGQPIGYTREYLFDCYEWLQGIFSDNINYLNELAKEYGYSLSKMHVLYAPVLQDFKEQRLNSNRVLWASRLESPKNYKILPSLAKLHPDLHFHIYGTKVLDHSNDDVLSELRKMKNVSLKGAYNSFNEIINTGYMAYIYSSYWDGLPNTILEAGSSGLPIVSNIVGGIGDLINSENAYIVNDLDSVEEYSKRLQEIKSDLITASKKASEVKKLISQRHTAQQFFETLKDIKGYF